MAPPKDNGYSREYAERLDRQSDFRNFRSEFVIPTKADLKRKTLAKPSNTSDDRQDRERALADKTFNRLVSMQGEEDGQPCIYLSGNSLGLQPRRTAEHISSHLSAWASKGVTGHFRAHDDSQLPPFVNVDDVAAEKMAVLVGAAQHEVAVMETLTANLHILMASFYRPTEERYKIILEGGAFPSDHYAVESHIRHHGLDIRDAMVLIEPVDGDSPNISTSHVYSVIDKHASSAALILLPGIQYYTGQCFDIQRITDHAHSHGIISGWDLAHAVGNVDMELHNWDVDFAVWCNYKYVNAGPGAIAGLFVHEKHGSLDTGALGDNREGFRPRLSGWWGSDKATRFEMDNRFVPIAGAAGFQLGNPSVLAITALLASLEVFGLTSMVSIRAQSMALTGYLEDLLLATSQEEPYKIITPSCPVERGAQLSLRLKPGLLVGVMKYLEDSGVVVDERKPDVIRVAPVPLYNSFCDVWDFVHIFKEACKATQEGHLVHHAEATMIQGKREKGWSQIM